MANLSITSQCNRHCAYCFAQSALASYAQDHAVMPLKVFDRALDFLVRSGLNEVRLLGGEPTLHPKFNELIDRVISRGLHVALFTGGLINQRILDRLALIEPERLSVLVNVIVPVGGDPAASRRQEETYRRLGKRVILGMNIPFPGIELRFLLDLIDRYGLRRHIRLGLAHPAVGGQNQYLHHRHYPEVGRRAFEFGLEARGRDVVIDWDCGWVPCMFPDGALQELGLMRDIGLRCNPILDVLVDGRVIACYPLGALGEELLPETEDAAWLRSRFSARLAGNSGFFLFKQCAECHWRASSACTGGCKAAALLRVRRARTSLPPAQFRPAWVLGRRADLNSFASGDTE